MGGQGRGRTQPNTTRIFEKFGVNLSAYNQVKVTKPGLPQLGYRVSAAVASGVVSANGEQKVPWSDVQGLLWSEIAFQSYKHMEAQQPSPAPILGLRNAFQHGIVNEKTTSLLRLVDGGPDTTLSSHLLSCRVISQDSDRIFSLSSPISLLANCNKT